MIWKPDDYKIVPEKIQASIVEFIEKTLFPEILARIEPECLELSGIPIRSVSLRHFGLSLNSLESSSSFVKQHHEYLTKLIVVNGLPATTFFIINGKDLTGAAIHIIKDMTNQKMEDDLRNIVKDCFLPNENPDLTFPRRCLSFHWLDDWK